MRASVSTWRLLDGRSLRTLTARRPCAWPRSPQKGLVGAFAVQTAPDAVTVVVVDGGESDDPLGGLAEKLTGRAEPVAEQVGPAQDLIALADDGRFALR